MIGLLRSELLRLRSRRLLKIILLVVVAGMLISVGSTFKSSTRDPDVARRQAAESAARCRAQHGKFARLQGAESPSFSTPQNPCPPSLFLRDLRFDLRTSIGLTRVLGFQFLFLAFIVGVSFAGAEWGSGFAATLSGWEPRRGRLLVAKILVVVGLTAAVAFVLSIFYVIALYPAAEFRGVRPEQLGKLAELLAVQFLRVSALIGIVAGIGVSLATLARNSVGALVGAGVYGLFLERIVEFKRPGWSDWLLGNNILHIVDGRVPLRTAAISGRAFGPPLDRHISMFVPFGRLLLYFAVIVLLTYVVSQKRDIT